MACFFKANPSPSINFTHLSPFFHTLLSLENKFKLSKSQLGRLLTSITRVSKRFGDPFSECFNYHFQLSDHLMRRMRLNSKTLSNRLLILLPKDALQMLRSLQPASVRNYLLSSPWILNHNHNLNLRPCLSHLPSIVPKAISRLTRLHSSSN